MSHHRIAFTQCFGPAIELGTRDAQAFSQLFPPILAMWDKLVKWRIKRTDGYRVSVHRFHGPFHILFHEWEEFIKCSTALVDRFGCDHLSQKEKWFLSIFSVEHMLCPEETDPFSTKYPGFGGIFRGVGIGANLHSPDAIAEFHECLKVGILFSRFDHRHIPLIDVSLRSIEGDEITLFQCFAVDSQCFPVCFDLQPTCSNNTTFSPATGNKSCMTRHASTSSQDRYGGTHPFDIFRIGLFPDKDDLFAFFLPLHGGFRGKDNLAGGSSRPGWQTFGNRFGDDLSSRVKDRVEQLIQLIWLHTHHSLFLRDHFLIIHIEGHLYSGRTIPFPHTTLKHIEIPILNRKFDIQHVFIMLLEIDLDIVQLFVHFRHRSFK